MKRPDHETEGDRMEALRKAWTFRVREGPHSNKYDEVRLEDPVIRQLEMIKRKIHSPVTRSGGGEEKKGIEFE